MHRQEHRVFLTSIELHLFRHKDEWRSDVALEKQVHHHPFDRLGHVKKLSSN